MVERQPPRSTVRQYPCPACGAIPGEPCVGARGKVRVSHHMERVVRADQGEIAKALEERGD